MSTPRTASAGPCPFLAAAAAVSLTVVGCGDAGDPTPPPVDGPPAVAPTASVDWLADWDNLGDGRDLRARVVMPASRDGLAAVRLVVVAAGSAGAVDTTVALAAPPSASLTLPASLGSVEVSFDEGATDLDGHPVEDGGSYVVVALSEGASGVRSALSPPSSPVTLAVTDLVRTVSAPIAGGTGGLEVAFGGDVLYADFGPRLGAPTGDRLYRVSPEGAVDVFAVGFRGASGNDLDRAGNLVQASIGGGFLSRVTPVGEVTTLATGLDGPVGVVATEGDTLYVAECFGNAVARVSPSGAVTTFAESGLFACPNGIARDEEGVLYVANFNDGNVLRVTPDGTVSVLASLPGGNNGHLLYAHGRLYVVARGAHRIYTVTLDGETSVLAGSGTRGARDGAARSARLSLPNDLALGPDGRTLYVDEVAATEGPSDVIAPTVIRKVVLVQPPGS